MTPPRSRPVRLGVAYYPEQWPEERWPVDARLMAEAGIRVARMAEFSWSTLEPRRGALEFGWLDRAVSLMAAHGIEVVIGTPTAAPPGWLIAEHPDILPVDHEGRVFPFGHRRHYCPNNATYHEESRRIVAALAERYGAGRAHRRVADRQRVRRALLLPALRGRLPRVARGALWIARPAERELGHGLLEPDLRLLGSRQRPSGRRRAAAGGVHACLALPRSRAGLLPLRLGQLRPLSAAADRRDPPPLGSPDHPQPEGVRVQGARLPEAGGRSRLPRVGQLPAPQLERRLARARAQLRCDSRPDETSRSG